MRVPLRWLRRLLDLPLNSSEIAERLRLQGVPVEEVEIVGLKEDKVRIGLVKEIEKHPNAQKLWIADVSLGDESITVVTAANNVRKGDIVPVALEGAVLNSGIKIEPRKLRGVLSQGMFCSISELGIDEIAWYDASEILILSRAGWDNYEEWKGYIGKPLDEVIPLWDEVLLLESFANRPDMFSIIGIAYEAAFAFKSQVKFPEILEEPEETISYPLQVRIEDDDCRRYQGRLLLDVKVKYSPLWMQQLLRFAGIRPINAVVDITNWVLVEMGQPLHAFDYDRIPDGVIVVRSAKPGEKLLALDGNEYHLTPDDLVIADRERPVALAGIIGGEETAITENSSAVLLESANFRPARIRRTSLRLGVRTESSIRFEKDLPIQSVHLGASRASWLIKELTGGRLVKLVDEYKEKPEKVVVHFNVGEVERILGKAMTTSEVSELLGPLGFQVEERGDGFLEIVPPPHRRDISIPADIVEEIARLKGYDYWGSALPPIVPTGYQSENERKLEMLRDLLVKRGYYEVITWSLTGEELLRKWDLNPDEHLKVINPLSSERSILRLYIYPELLEVVRRNVSYGERDFRLFEVGKVFQPPADEFYKLALVGVKPDSPESEAEVFHLRNTLEDIFKAFGLALDFESRYGGNAIYSWAHPYVNAYIFSGEDRIGFIAEVHPKHLEEMEIEGVRVALAEVDIRKLLSEGLWAPIYQKLSKYQKIYRDLSLLIPDNQKAGRVIEIAADVLGELLEDAFAFDIYRGLGVPDGYTSYTFRFFIRPKDKPLKEKHISKMLKEIAERAQEELKAELRGAI